MPDTSADPFAALSTRLAALVESVTPRLVAVHGRDGRASSGILWRPGLVVTAAETLEREEDITLALPDGRRVAATLAGRDAATDIALLRAAEADGGAGGGLALPPEAGDAEAALRPGHLLLALGLGEDGPIAALGIAAVVGGPWRSQRGGRIDRRIRLDLALHPAAEGGAVIDHAGRLLGMAVFGPRRRALVIPATTIARAAASLEARGRFARGYLGLAMQAVRVGGARNGLIVVGIDPRGPAERAGLVLGDVIVAWDGVPLAGGGVREVLERLDPDSVGRCVALELVRGGAPARAEVTIGERPPA
jgi:S1-C subfamily serine protease